MMALVINMYLRIRDLREDSDLTQKKIVELLNTNQSNYSKTERGVKALSLEEAIKLAQFYKTSVDYLVGLTDERTPYPKSQKMSRVKCRKI